MLEQVRGVGDLTDPLNVLIVELQTLEREAAPRGILDAPAAAAVKELALRDREQPSDWFARQLAPAIVDRDQSRGERLRCQVGGKLRVANATSMVGKNRIAMAAIEHIEPRAVDPACGEQQPIASRVQITPHVS
jgi:hypothetical protein